MRPSAFPILLGILLHTGVPASCEASPPAAGEVDTSEETNSAINMKENRITISVGVKKFTATLAASPSACAFVALLPLSLKMGDLHENEKFAQLSSRLPSNDVNPGTIQAGDLMLWNSSNVVLFYKSLPTSYRYTRLGRIDNPERLAAALGAGQVTIKFDLK